MLMGKAEYNKQQWVNTKSSTWLAIWWDGNKTL